MGAGRTGSAPVPRPTSPSLAPARYEALKDFAYHTPRTPKSEETGSSRWCLPCLGRPGRRGAPGLPVGSQRTALIFRVTHTPWPRRRLAVWRGVAAIQQPRARSRPRGLAPLMPLLARCRAVSREFVPVRNQQVLHAVHAAPAASKLGRWDRRGGRAHTEGQQSDGEDSPLLPAAASHTAPSLQPQLDPGSQHGVAPAQRVKRRGLSCLKLLSVLFKQRVRACSGGSAGCGGNSGDPTL